MIPHFIRTNPRLAFYAFVAVAASCFGQTFFVSVMGGEIRGAFGLSHAAYGSLYSGATLVSAVLLFRFGGLADTWPLPKVTALAVSALAAGCLLIGVSPGKLPLGLGFLLIRFGGQGFIAHLGATTAARYFPAHRGKAVAMAGLGFPATEAVLPAGAVLVMGMAGWRGAWVAGAAVLLLLVLPLLLFLSRGTPAPSTDEAVSGRSFTGPGYTRRQVVQDPGFYLVLPAALATPFVVTGFFFHQIEISQAHGWSLQVLAAAFSGYAAGHLATLFAAGPIVDRLGAGRSLPLAFLPMILGLVLLAVARGNWVAMAYMVTIGVTQGFSATATGAVWAERYGIRHLGSIRSLTQAIMVLSTAAAPILLGFLLDAGVGLTALGLTMAGGVAAASLLAWIAPRPPR